MNFELNKYPFLNGSKQVLGELSLTIDRIDESNVFDQVIKDSLHDIIKSFSNKKSITQEIRNDVKYEVAKFYTTLYILRSNPTKLMTRYWIKAYMNRLKGVITEDMSGKSFTFVSKLFDELGMPHKFVMIDNYQWMIIKVNVYLDFALEITRTDPIEYQTLTLINMPLHKGRVFIHTGDVETFFCMLVKLCEKKIKALIDTSDKIIRSKKVDECVDQLQKFLIDSSKLHGFDNNKQQDKRLEFGETTPEMEIQHEKNTQRIIH